MRCSGRAWTWSRPRASPFAVPLGEYDIPERAHELCVASARIAREVADGYGGFVAGSMGPGTKSPSLGQISFAALRDAYGHGPACSKAPTC